jgi:hypothetical protein
MNIDKKAILKVISMVNQWHSEETADQCDSNRNQLKEFLSGLPHQELIELMAVMSVGRGDPGSDNFQSLVNNIHLNATRIVDYLMDKPCLGEDLEKGMRKLGLGAADE